MSKRLFDADTAAAHNERVRVERNQRAIAGMVEKVVAKPPKRAKYGNVHTVVDGIRFDSKHEARCWQDLKLREKAGEIRCLQRQVSFPLEVAGKRVQRWRADFWYYEQDHAGGWTLRVADAKSGHTVSLNAWKRTSALFTALYGLEVTVLL